MLQSFFIILAMSSTAMAAGTAVKQEETLVIGEIAIVTDNIFDLSDPKEDRALYRLANRAHFTTREDVVRQQLLFTSGGKFSQQALDESERILRSNRYIQDVAITAVKGPDGTVNVDVQTSDVWTLMPKITLSRSGGQNNAGIGIKEGNLLGTGIAVEMTYKSDVDRDSRRLKFVDRNLGGSWYALRAHYSDNSDGAASLLAIEKPFYALTSTAASGFIVENDDKIESRYQSGEITDQFRHQKQYRELYIGRSAGLVDGWSRRLVFGVASDRQRFSEAQQSEYQGLNIPEDRELQYPFVAYELLQDKYEKSRNYDQISRNEDRFTGTRINARLGFSSSIFASDREALIVNLNAQTGFGHTDGNSLLLSTSIGTRWERGGAKNLLVDMHARFYRRQSEYRMLFASLGATIGSDLDRDQQIWLGGDNGLRGYPIRYQNGDRRVLLTLEQRFFTDWYPFRLFRIGAAVFFDAGRAWSSNKAANDSNRILRDVGFGLRIGSTRSGLGRMTHIDVAFPLDGDNTIKDVQFLIQTRKSF